jgi:hypothetical protein
MSDPVQQTPEKFKEIHPTDKYQPKTPYIDIARLTASPFYQVRKYNDSIYYGEIQENQRNGNGAMAYNNGRYYEGDWKNDYRHGKGYELYLNQNTYEGEFSLGKAEGKGVYKWANGEIFDGEWKQGLKEGDGVWKGKLLNRHAWRFIYRGMEKQQGRWVWSAHMG